MKKVLIVLGILIISLELGLYFFWYKEFKFMEFFGMLGLCHVANTAIIFGILNEVFPKSRKNLKEYVSLVLIASFFILLYFNSYRIQNQIDKHGIYTNGVVIEKKYGAKTSPYVITEFIHNGSNYQSQLTIPDSREFKKVKLGDSVLIKFVKEYPKMMCRTEKLFK